jgi:predicted RNase H-like HicB family nuclease
VTKARLKIKSSGLGMAAESVGMTMTIRDYIAIVDRAPGEVMWSIVFPDFPGVTSGAADSADVPTQARDALATAIEDMIAEGEELPASVEESPKAPVVGDEYHDPHYVVALVEIAESPTRVNVSIDRALLKHIDAPASSPKAPANSCGR